MSHPILCQTPQPTTTNKTKTKLKKMSINWTNKLGPKPIINRPISDKGLDAMHCSALVDALAEVLSHHALACVSGLNLHDKPWLFDVDANDSPLITPESCKCSTNSKYLRAILPANHPKGFSQNNPAQDNNNNQTN